MVSLMLAFPLLNGALALRESQGDLQFNSALCAKLWGAGRGGPVLTPECTQYCAMPRQGPLSLCGYIWCSQQLQVLSLLMS